MAAAAAAAMAGRLAISWESDYLVSVVITRLPVKGLLDHPHSRAIKPVLPLVFSPLIRLQELTNIVDRAG